MLSSRQYKRYGRRNWYNRSNADENGRIESMQVPIDVADLLYGFISAFNWWRSSIFHQSAFAALEMFLDDEDILSNQNVILRLSTLDVTDTKTQLISTGVAGIFMGVSGTLLLQYASLLYLE